MFHKSALRMEWNENYTMKLGTVELIKIGQNKILDCYIFQHILFHSAYILSVGYALKSFK